MARVDAGLADERWPDPDALGDAEATADAVKLIRRLTRAHIRKLLRDERSAIARFGVERAEEIVGEQIEFAETVFMAFGGNLDDIEADHPRRAR